MELPKSVSNFFRFLAFFLIDTGLPAWGTAFTETPDIYSISPRNIIKNKSTEILVQGANLEFVLKSAIYLGELKVT